MLEIQGDSGTAVLLLPGGAEAVDGFFPGLVEALRADPGCRVILYDRPGVEGSSVAGGLADATDAIHTTLADLGVGPVVVIGQSLGAAVAVLLAHDRPDDVAGLVLIDPTPINDPALARMVAKRAEATARAARIPGVTSLLRALLRASTKKSARTHDMSPEAKAALRKMTELDIARLGASVAGMPEIADAFDESRLPHVPALVLTADRKPTDPIRLAHQRLATALDAPLIAWPRAEHAMHLTNQAQVIAAAQEVVRNVSADRAA